MRFWVKLLLITFITAAACIQSVTVLAQCTSYYQVSSNLCEDDTVSFTFTGNANTVRWTYGDSLSGLSNIDTNRNSRHVFTGPGNYTIICIASDTSCADTSSFNLTIVNRPTLSFSSSNTCLGLTTSFQSSITLDPQDSVKSIRWSLDSNLTKSGSMTSHSYTAAANKNITLYITTKAGCIDSVQKTIRIKDSVSITFDTDTLCQSDLLKFNASPQNETPTNWNWNFGDSTSSNVQSPQHSYQSPGDMRVSLEVTYSDGEKCSYSGDSIYVRPVPNAGFILTSDAQQCFKGNRVCLSFSPNQAELKYRRVIWDNGGASEPNPSDSTACFTYSDAFGGNYYISSELVDIFGCAASFSSTQQVMIRKEIIASFDQSSQGGCFGATISVQNTSNTLPPAIEAYLWDFGNGVVDSTNWDSAQQLYTSNGFFVTILSLRDTFGCIDTFKSQNSLENVYFAVDAKLDTTLNFCENNNSFIFSQTTIPGAAIRWDFGDEDISFLYNTSHRYETFGKYVPRAIVTKKGCQDTAILDTITVYGPVASFGIRNRFQCTIHDTVTFTNLSNVFENGPLQVSWQIFDPFAPNCVLDTKNGANVGSNCNRSLDSLTFKHWFTPGTERCFYGKLVVLDTLTGCSDSLVQSIPLMPPSADTGLRSIFSTLNPCPGPEEAKTIQLDLSQTKPGCDQERWYVMWDSLCAEKSGNFDSNWVANEYFHNYSYARSSCDSNGRVTIGLILQNGLDSLGNVCRDTGFYHHIITLPLQNPSFNSTYNPDSIYCRNSSFDFYFTDTIQDTSQQVIWNFGDGTFDTTANFNTVSHTYFNSGAYRVQVILSHNNGCVATYDMMVPVGINKQYTFPKNEVCLGDSVEINNISTYWDGRTFGSANYAGETYWDIGDSLTPIQFGPSIYLNYSRIGDYPIQLYMEDSIGCKDTLNVPISARVFSVFASWIELPDTLVCPQVIRIDNTSSVFDSTTNFYHQDDSIKEQLWTFNLGTGSSSLQNPTKFFNVGMNVYKLRVENTRGCVDTIVDSSYVTTPKANFDVIGGDKGCQPHLTLFKNTSLNANNYIWFLKDNGNNVINTEDIEVPYEYIEYGLFYPELIAEFSFRRNGIKYSCYDTFPGNQSTSSKPKIRVFERPINIFSYSTNCETQTTSFQNRTRLLTDTIQSVLWLFGDGDSSNLLSPTHRYLDTGVYLVTMRTLSGSGCEQEITKSIIISPEPIANFSFDNVCEGALTNLADKTKAFNDRIYRWNWDLGDGSFSYINNPKHLFDRDSTYTVSLAVTNRAGCSDTVSQVVEVYDKPTAMFDSDSLCLYDSFSFASMSYTKTDTLLVHWEFGDGAENSDSRTRHLYSSEGEFVAKLVVTTNDGCKDSSTRITKVFHLPKSSFSVNSDTQCLSGNTFEFINNSTIDEGAISSHLWTASDLSTDTIYDFSFVSDTVGSFDITLISTSNVGCKDTFSMQQVVLESPKTFLKESSKDVCSQDELVTFEDSTTSNFGNIIISRDWDIEDTPVSTDSMFTYRFLEADTFDVRLIITFSNNCKDTSYTSIIARPKPTSRFHIDELEKCLPWNEYTFTDSSFISDSTSLTSNWDLGNKDSNDQIRFNYTYAEDDTFNVRLISASSFGCSDTSFKDLVVFPHPEANFQIDTPSMCLIDNQFSFDNQSVILSGTMSYRWQFGEIGNSILADPTYTFDSSGRKTISLIASSDNGCIDTAERTVEVYPQPKALIALNDTAQCLNQQEFIFTDSSNVSDGVLSRRWIWSDQKEDTAFNVVKQFDAVGIYKHQLISITEQSCRDTATIEHRVLPLPTLGYTLNDTAQCLDNNLFVFSSLADTTITYTYRWDFGDMVVDSTQSPAHSYEQSGKYIVRLTLETKKLCRDTIKIPVEVYYKPEASFTTNDTDQCLNANQFELKGESIIQEGRITTYRWSIDGREGYGPQDTSFRFDDVGTFVLTYIVESSYGCLDTTNQQVTLHPNPITKIFIDDTIQCARSNLFSIESRSSIAYGTFYPTWFHDGIKLSDSSQYEFNSTNTDTIQVTLIDSSSRGCIDTASSSIYIVPNPVSGFEINDSRQCLDGNQVDYKNTSTSGLGSLTYEWTYGEGTSDTSKNTTHRFRNHGYFISTLIAQTSFGCADTFEKQMFIYPMPKAEFSLNDTSLCETENKFLITNNSTIDSTDIFFTWHWGDGDTSQSIEPSHRYDSYGDYTIILRVSSEYGCWDSIAQNITVDPMPVADFEINNSEQCVNNQNFTFRNMSSIVRGNLINFAWQIESNSFSNPDSLNFYFSKSGSYPIALITISDKNCRDTAEQNLMVFPKPNMEIVVNDSLQCLRGNRVNFTAVSKNNVNLESYDWLYKDTLVGVDLTYQKSFSSPGVKTVSLIVKSIDNCFDSISTSVRIKPMPDPSFEKLEEFYCIHEGPFNLIPVQSGGLFSGKSIISQKYVPTILWEDSVTYTLELEGCIDSSSQKTNVYPPPSVNFPLDTSLCKYESFVLDAASFSSTYLWQDKTTEPTYRVRKPGIYYVRVTNMCGIVSDTSTVAYRSNNCRIYLPTAFTPNKDALNRFYKPITYDVRGLEYEIYNRWGEKLFEGDLNNPGWDGTYKDERCAIGWYVVIVQAYFDTPTGPVRENMSEVVYLIR